MNRKTDMCLSCNDVVANAYKGQDSYSKAGTVAYQVMSSIRTIIAFSGQKREIASYVYQFDLAFKTGKQRAIATGIGLGMIIGAFALGNVGPNISSFASTQRAAYMIFKAIFRIPIIDSVNPKGARPENIQAHIVVTNVDLAYSSCPNVPILKQLSGEIKPGQSVILVGHSESGKSTIVRLVECFYDPLCYD
ncbi:putative P-glycoprotein-like protein [Linnemannia elongata]|nr:putative P-glycoprotein-like protein [Linnemannia elongata]